MENEIRVIVFDLGNVLIPFHYDIIVNKLNELEDGLGESFVEKYKANYNVHRSFEKGEMSEDEFIEIMLDWTKGKVNAEKFKKIYSEIFTVNEKIVALLPQLKKQYRLMLLSNTNSIHKKYGWEKFPFLSNFEKLFLSHELGAVKPEEAIYLAVQNYDKEPPSAHLFIDDVKEYVEAAQKLGWRALHFTTEEETEPKLLELIFRK